MSLTRSAKDLLGVDGPFARLLDGFAPRLQQQAMAEAVERALAEDAVLVAEAGTGTGKTLAYLVPALRSGKKVIVSTGTRNLQDQLFNRDLPLVLAALDGAGSVALLKGRGNYLCPHRLDLALADGRYRSREEAAQLQAVRRWAGATTDGDIAEFSDLAEDSPLWPRVTSSADNCLGSDCPRFDDCFLMRARRRAQEADLLVVNHHLLFADMALRRDGVGELLPGANAFILDEAHQLAEAAVNFFGIALTGHQLLELARDCAAEETRAAGDSRAAREAAAPLEGAVLALRAAFGEEPRRLPWAAVAPLPRVRAALHELEERLAALGAALAPLAERGKTLEACRRRWEELTQRLASCTGAPPAGHVHWLETHPRSFALNLTPLDIADLFGRHLRAQRAAWVLTSATLAVGGRFDHFTADLGLGEAVRTARWDSPFDFPRQAVLYVPEGLPDPARPDYTAAVVARAAPVIEASRGRCFLLFTSHRALQEAARLLAGRLDYPLLIQGEAPRSRLLEHFRTCGNAVLLGTGSFWEGVDVRGEALSCVIIDKLPFAAPGDPLMQARLDALRGRGRNPFLEYQLPQAVIALKQGAGRLIRDVGDSGVLMLCDPRLGSRGYGRLFLDSLPPMTRTRRLEVVQRFFALKAAGNTPGPAR